MRARETNLPLERETDRTEEGHTRERDQPRHTVCRVSSGLSERLKFLPGLFEKSHIVVEGVVDRVARIGDGRRRRRRGQRSEATGVFFSLWTESRTDRARKHVSRVRRVHDDACRSG